MMEASANAELRGRTLPILSPGKEKQAWRRALSTLIRGFRSADAIDGRIQCMEPPGSSRNRRRLIPPAPV
jgi:hypothetical protein